MQIWFFWHTYQTRYHAATYLLIFVHSPQLRCDLDKLYIRIVLLKAGSRTNSTDTKFGTDSDIEWPLWLQAVSILTSEAT
jgi:hypothetical protein